MDITVLIADDDPVFRQLVCDIVHKEGFKSLEASDGRKALAGFFGNLAVDLVILDVMMPEYDGWEVLKEIRERSDVPVLMLTALGDETHEVQGLKKGADDYISKPFSYPVFVARLHALLRKAEKMHQQPIREGSLRIDQALRKTYVGNVEVALNRKEYNLLLYLIANKHRILTREQIIDGVWGYSFEGDIRTIDAHVKMLRAKLLECGEYIQTKRGTGYFFEANV